MKLVKMRLHWSKVDPKANMTGVLMRREKTQRHTQAENHEMLGAETGTMLTHHGKVRIGSAPRSQERGTEQFPPEPSVCTALPIL